MGSRSSASCTRRGARVAFVARTAERVDEVARSHPGAIGIVGDVARKEDIYPIALQIAGNLGGLDVLVNNASSLGPVPLALLADTECEDLELALATNVLGPFRLTKALLGALAASARDGRGSVVLNISSDAAVNAYPQWGAYGASKAALRHMSRIWDEELAAEGRSRSLARSGRHGHAAARAGGAGCRPGDAQAAGDGRARARRCHRRALPRSRASARARAGRSAAHDCRQPARPAAARRAGCSSSTPTGASATRRDRGSSTFCDRAIS